MRAIAVASVVLYHAGLSCPGGYVGVDVFFVLSGYLITALLLRDLQDEKFSIVSFWERRIRRIFPVLSVAVLATLAVGSFWILPGDAMTLGRSAVAQTLMSANFFFWKQGGGYFADSGVHPLLHTWSLAVEEQFYVFFPLLLLLLFRKKAWAKPESLSIIFSAGFVASLLLAAVMVPLKPSASFFLLPTRAWELLGGALLAALPIACFRAGAITREIVSWAGLAGMLIPVWWYTHDTPFPGLAALPPCLGTMAVIWSNTRVGGDSAKLTMLGRLLAMRGPVFVGLISYSLYLWHWPVIVYFQYGQPPLEYLPLAARLGLVAASVGLAVLSWRFIETPFRVKRVAGSRQTIFAFAGATATASLVMGGSIALSGGLSIYMPEPIGSAMRLNGEAQNDRGAFFNVTTQGIEKNQLFRFGASQDHTPPTLLLWGDSHARHALPALNRLCLDLQIKGEAVVYSSTTPVFEAVFPTKDGLNGESPRWAEAVMRHIEKHRIKHVVLAAYWSGRQVGNEALLENALRETVKRLDRMGCSVWVLMDVPDQPFFASRAIVRNHMTGETVNPWIRTEAEHRHGNSVLYRLAAEKLPATFLDPAPLLLQSESGRYRISADGVSLYYDLHHLTTRGSELVLLPLLRSTLGEAILRDSRDPRTASAR